MLIFKLCDRDVHCTTTMQIEWIALLTLQVTKLFAARNQIARDYFVYKHVQSVVAFLCRDTANNFDFTKMLNMEGIRVAVLYPESNFSLETVTALEYSRFGVFLDLYCPNSYSEFVLTESSKLRTYDALHNWLLFGKSLNESIEILDDDAFSISTDLVIVTPSISGVYELYDVYNHGKDRSSELNVTTFADWHSEKGLNVTLVQEKYERRRNFHGMTLKVIVVTQYRPDYLHLKDYLQDYNTKPLDSMSKFAYTVLLHLADMFNFTMQIVETSLWDQVDHDGEHQGMLGMLHRSEADFGGTPARTTLDRSILTQLILPIWPFRTCFIFRSMRTRLHDEFFRPLTIESWTSTGIMFIISVIVLSLTFKLEFVKEKLNTWNQAVLVITGIMCQQGSAFTPKCVSGRIVLMNLLLFSLLIYNYYSASVVSAQFNQSMDKMNDSLHELVKSQLTVAAEPITYTNYGLTALKDWEIQEFYEVRWKPLTDDIRYMSLQEGLERVAKGGFAYHTDPNTAYHYIERLFSDQMICELTEVHLFPPQKMSLFGRRNSPFTKMARIGLTKMRNAGIITRQIKRWESRKPVCFREASIVRSVTLLTTAPAFIILSIGIFLASLICFVENVIAKSRN